ncbi:MAG: M14 family metallopeptidase [Erysipelotrichaceae bacterium]
MNKIYKGRLLNLLLVSAMVLPCVASLTYPVMAEDLPTITFSNGITPRNSSSAPQVVANTVSMTDKKTFNASVIISGKTLAEVEAMIKADSIVWDLSRPKGIQNEKKFPHQYLGGKLKDWKVVTTSNNVAGTPLFNTFTTTAKELATDKTKVQLDFSFKNELLFGYNGIDGRDRGLVRNKLLDYTGDYELSCSDAKGTKMASTSMRVAPYDSFHLQSEVDKELAEIAIKLNAKGIYAKVEKIGVSSNGADMNTIFIAKSADTLTKYQALSERTEKEPTKVLEEIKNKTLKDYQVPVMYSNVHADESPGTDGNMEFLHALAESDSIDYKMIDGLTAAGQTKLNEEMSKDGTVWSDLIDQKKTLAPKPVSGVGYIQGSGAFEPTDPKQTDLKHKYHNPDAAVNLSDAEFNSYYNVSAKKLDVKAILDHIFFIVVPSENVDAKNTNTRTNGNGFDLNRDNTYQTQAETIAMTNLIAKWNPLSFYEIHGFYTQFQVEPCSPTHEPNVEYDLFIQNALAQGEGFGSAAIANNDTINSFQMPMRDYLKKDATSSTGKFWASPFDDMSTSYTPQYSFLHGVNGYTVEVPYGSNDAVKAIKYGFIENADFVAANKEAMFINQVTGYERGVKNIDADSIRKFYVSQKDEEGKEANIFREKHKENNNFFPEAYIIPYDEASQEDLKAANEMVTYLLRNDVEVKQLEKDTKINGKDYKAGTIVVDMHQAKRNMANAALYDNIVISSWTALYSEPLTAFSQCRGFDMDVITKIGALDNASVKTIAVTPATNTIVNGKIGDEAIIENNSLDSVLAVNDLLRAGKKVGYVYAGENKGDFVTSYTDFASIKDKYILKAERTKDIPSARVIKKAPKVYIPGRDPEIDTDYDDQAYGLDGYYNQLNTTLNWDYFALGKQLGFDLVATPAEADIIVGNQYLGYYDKKKVYQFQDEAAYKAIEAGKPYLAYTPDTLDTVKNLVPGFEFNRGYKDMEDALSHVTYEEASMITDKYVMEKDDIMYGYGGASITKYPEGAKVLIKATNDQPMEGFMHPKNIEKYKNSIQAVEYKTDKLDLTVFANSLTNKAHQTDDYRFISNTIYSKVLGEVYKLDLGLNIENNISEAAGYKMKEMPKFSYKVEYDGIEVIKELKNGKLGKNELQIILKEYATPDKGVTKSIKVSQIATSKDLNWVFDKTVYDLSVDSDANITIKGNKKISFNNVYGITKKDVNTGDTTQSGLLFFVISISGVAIALLALKKRKA